MKMQNERVSWIMGASLIALTMTLSGCLEGNGADRYGVDPSYYSNPSEQTMSSSVDLLNAKGISVLDLPLGTAMSSAANLSLVYPVTISVATEDELASALVVASGESPHKIILTKPIVIDRPLVLRGDVQIVNNGSVENDLKTVEGGGIDVEPNLKAAADVQHLQECSTSSWQMLARASSLRLGVPTAGKLTFTGSGFLQLIIAAQSEAGASFWLELSNSDDALVYATTWARDTTVVFSSSRSFLISTGDNIVHLGTRRLDGDRSLVIDKNPSYPSATQSLSGRDCHNLKADVLYPVEAYGAVMQNCYTGRWDELANSFANCGGQP